MLAAQLPAIRAVSYFGERARFEVKLQRDPNLHGGREVKWSSTDTAVFTVDAEGVVAARANGEAGLVAELMGLHDTAQVRTSNPDSPTGTRSTRWCSTRLGTSWASGARRGETG